MHKTIIIIQARMGSQRLPGKSLMAIYNNTSLIEMVITRCKIVKKSDLIVLATSKDPNCDPLAHKVRKSGCEVIRGDEHDVLSRFQTAIKKFCPENVVRVCADNPLISPVEIDHLIDFYFAGNFDYAENDNDIATCGLPDGLGAHIFKANLLMNPPSAGFSSIEKEHVNEYIIANPDKFKLGAMKYKNIGFSNINLDINTRDDLERIRLLCNSMDPQNAPYWEKEEIIETYRSLF